MADKNDAYDPTYSKDPNYVWDPPSGEWVPRYTGPGAPPAKAGETSMQGIDGREIDPNKPNYAYRGPAEKPLAFKEVGKSPFMQDIQKQLESRMAGTGLPQTSFATPDAERARGTQMQLLEQLLAQAAGTAPSPAQAMLQQAADRNIADASAMAQSQRGLGATAAQSQVAGQRAEIGQEASRDAGILRLQEQMQATQAAGRLAEGLRGQDVAQEQARAQVKIASDNLYQSLIENARRDGLSMEQAIMQANVAMAGIQSNRDISFADQALRRWGMQETFRRNDRDFVMNLVGGFGDAMTGLAGL